MKSCVQHELRITVPRGVILGCADLTFETNFTAAPGRGQNSRMSTAPDRELRIVNCGAAASAGHKRGTLHHETQD